ncbi:MAG: 4Fe-4S dicluster domain-containing protein [Eubacteriales bacterium]|nr:4Fe-4S dicluster domain-containing protein [Eubacteriales bacterium]
MRGVQTSVNSIRTNIYSAIAKLSYDYNEADIKDMHTQMEQLPYDICPGEVSNYREDVFLERAIIRERLRLAMGLPLRRADEMGAVSQGLEEAVKPEKYYQPPLINVIKFACHSCPDNVVKVTDVCQGCLARPCTEVCPKKAVSVRDKRSVIDQDLCIKCGKCVDACPYGAIKRMVRPCASACGMKAIGSDEYGRADIDQDKCVSCGMCLANCPFGAIADKAQIFQLIQAIKDKDTPVFAAIAPAVAGQFGHDLTPGRIRSAFKALGFEDAVEVAIGADLCTLEEANDFINEVPEKLPFMATSCCPAWSMMAKKLFPDNAKCISMALTPMVLTGRLLKKKYPNCKVAFIGPCSAKKLEASRRTIRSDIDFVLTFEEVMGMFEAKEVDFTTLPEIDSMHGGSADGRGFAVSGGVAKAVVNCIKETHPEMEVKVASAQGLEECRTLLLQAKAGKFNGYLLEGMACPGGCVAGVGTIQPIAKSKGAVAKHQSVSTNAHATANVYQDMLHALEEDDLKSPDLKELEAAAAVK